MPRFNKQIVEISEEEKAETARRTQEYDAWFARANPPVDADAGVEKFWPWNYHVTMVSVSGEQEQTFEINAPGLFEAMEFGRRRMRAHLREMGLAHQGTHTRFVERLFGLPNPTTIDTEDTAF